MGGPGNHPSRISGRWTPSATGSLLEDENVVHVDGNGIREGYRNRRAELILKDLDTVERKLGKLKTPVERRQEDAGGRDYYRRIREHLSGAAGRVRTPRGLTRVVARGLHLLTGKPVPYIANGRKHHRRGYVAVVRKSRRRKTPRSVACTKLEA